MLAEKAFDRIVIGASTLQDFEHQTSLMGMLGSEENPLEAIDGLLAKENKTNGKSTSEDTMMEK
jgi:hypothetical protein